MAGSVAAPRPRPWPRRPALGALEAPAAVAAVAFAARASFAAAALPMGAFMYSMAKAARVAVTIAAQQLV